MTSTPRGSGPGARSRWPTRVGEPAAARDGYEVLSNVALFRGELAGALEFGRRSAELARSGR